MQRLIIVGFLQMIPQEWLRLQAGLVTTLMYTIALLYFKPYKRDDIDMLAIGAQITLLGIFLGSVNIKLYSDLASTTGSTDITGFNSQREAEVAMVIFTFLSVGLFLASTLYMMITRQEPRSVRLVENSLPPDLGLHSQLNYHVFLSHRWSSGQDQAATIKRQLQYAFSLNGTTPQL